MNDGQNKYYMFACRMKILYFIVDLASIKMAEQKIIFLIFRYEMLAYLQMSQFWKVIVYMSQITVLYS